MRRRIMGTLLVVLSSVFFLAVSELVVSFILPDRYYVWPPNFKMSFDLQPEVIHGVSSPHHLTINGIGLRGDPPSEDASYRLLTVGASTTICVYLDDSKAWPYLLQERLNEVLGPKTVWVGNAGRPGHSTPQHVLQVEKLLKQHPEIDGVVLLVGIADLLVHLSSTIGKGPVFDEGPNGAMRRAFSVFPDWDLESPWYSRNVIGRLTRLRNWHPIPIKKDGVFAMDERGEFTRIMRMYRKSRSSLIRRLPDIRAAIAVYSRNLHSIIDRAEELGKRVIFLTQPALWRRGMPKSEQDLIWGGGVNFFHIRRGMRYYSPGAMADAMAIYNNALLEVCREREVECVDLAGMVPRSAKEFYDDAHFTESGSAIVADRFAEYLLGKEPLRPSRSR